MPPAEDLPRRVEAVCRMPLSTRVLRERLLGVLRPYVPFDAHVFALTDPVTNVATSPHADVPMLPWERLPELIRWRYLTLVTRPDRMAAGCATSLRTATGSPEESPMWRHVQRDVGVVDTATVAFKDRYGMWGFLDLWRTTAEFTPAELGLMSSIAAPVTAGLRAALARTFAEPGDDGTLGPAVVVLGPELAVRDQTEGAAAALFRLLPRDEPVPPIPAAAYNAGAALVAYEEGVPLGEPWSRVHLGGNQWVTVKASRLGADIAVSIEASTPAERLDLMTRTHGLSERESVVLSLLAAGLDTRAIAGRLVVSEHTAADHVKALLAKTGARTRQVLLARVLGTG